MRLGLGVSLNRAHVGVGVKWVPSLLGTDAKVAFIGDSISSLYGPRAYNEWSNLYSNGLWYNSYSYGKFGITGNTVQQVAARLDDALVTNPDIVVVECGTNNLLLWTTAIDIQNDVIPVWQQIINYYWSKRKRVVIGGIANRNGLTTPQNNGRLACNAWASALAAQYPTKLAYADPSSLVPGTDTYDGLHPKPQGSSRLAGREGLGYGPALLTFFQPGLSVLPIATTADNLLGSAGTFTGTGGTLSGGATGVVSDGWTLANSIGATVVGSKTIVNGFDAMVITVSGTAAAAGLVTLSKSGIALSPAYVAGEGIEIWAKISLAAGAQNLKSVSPEQTGNAWGITLDYGGQVGSEVVDFAVDGVLRSMGRSLVATTSSTTASFNLGFLAGTIAATLTISQAFMRKRPAGFI